MLTIMLLALISLFLCCRAGGDWSTTYAPSPFYMTSKMRSLYLEGYDYSVFDLTKHDKVQIQVVLDGKTFCFAAITTFETQDLFSEIEWEKKKNH